MFGKLFEQIKFELVAGLIVSLVVLYMYHSAQVAIMAAELARAGTTIAELQASNTVLSIANKQAVADIDTQNKHVELLKETMLHMSQEAEAALLKVKKDADKWRGQYTALLTSPGVGDTECAKVDTLLRKYHSLRLSEMKEVSP